MRDPDHQQTSTGTAIARCVLCATLAMAAWHAAAQADSVTTRALETREIAPGVYTIRHPDPTDDFPDGNTTVVIGDHSVLVVDTCYLPSSARRDIERIRSWTSKPVRYVVNTHWHNDHVGGNHAYLQAFPGAQVIAHEQTRVMMDARIGSYIRRFLADDGVFGLQRAALRRIADEGRDADGATVPPERRDAARRSLQRFEQAVMEFRNFTYQPPTMTFDSQLHIDLGGRTVDLRFVGRGNTGGDIVAVLPKERILIAGDLVDHPVPYAFGGYPSEWVRTLQSLSRLDVNLIVPGHGAVLRDKAYLGRVIELLQTVVRHVTELVDRRGGAATIEEATKTLDLSAMRRAMAGDDPDSQEFFDASMASLLRVALAEAKAR